MPFLYILAAAAAHGSNPAPTASIDDGWLAEISEVQNTFCSRFLTPGQVQSRLLDQGWDNYDQGWDNNNDGDAYVIRYGQKPEGIYNTRNLSIGEKMVAGRQVILFHKAINENRQQPFYYYCSVIIPYLEHQPSDEALETLSGVPIDEAVLTEFEQGKYRQWRWRGQEGGNLGMVARFASKPDASETLPPGFIYPGFTMTTIYTVSFDQHVSSLHNRTRER